MRSFTLVRDAIPNLVLASNGNVGIGTTSPTLLFQVGSRGGFGSDGIFYWGSALTGNNRGTLSWDTDIASVNAANNLVFGTNGTSPRMRITSAGDVGISTASPAGKLDVVGITYLGSDTNNSLFVNSNTTVTRVFAAGRSTFSNSALSIGSSNSTSTVEAIRIGVNGNVGVGSTNPAVKFVVSNANAEGYEINPTGGVGGGATVSTYNRTTSAYTTLTTYSSAMTWFVGSAGTTRAIDIISSGNVGISNTAPADKLSVNGTTYLGGVTTFAGNLVLGTVGLSANGGFGSAGQVLHSNGTATYWGADDGITYDLLAVANTAVNAGILRLRDSANANDDVLVTGTGTTNVSSNATHIVINSADQYVGTVTSVSSGNGLTGSFTTSGSLAVLANTGIVANATGVFVNASYIATISSNNSTNLNGQPASFYTNASNLDTGTIPYARIPANVINTTAAFTITGVHTYNANVILGTAGLSANGGFGSAGQVLHSNGTTTYWAADDGITSLVAANGLSGGTISSTGQLDVVGGSGLVSNVSGVHIGQGNGITVSADAINVTGGTTLTVNTSGVHVNSTLSLTDLTVTGNLTVSGTTTYINTTSLSVGDNIITLNADLPGATAPTENAGIEVNRGSSANVQFLWDETNDRWSTNGQPIAISSLVAAGAASGITTLGAGNTTITGFMNASVSVNTASFTVGSTVIANTSGTYATQLNGQLASFYTNASNINTGTLPYAQIPANVINTTAAFTRTGVTTFSANVILGTSGLSANGGFGLAGEVLRSTGTSVYWSTAGGNTGIGTVISVGSGDGLTGGPIESSGSLAVLANTGIVANSLGTFVNASYIATISANNATYLNGQAASFYTNASNLDTGTIPYARIPANIVNTTASFTITGVHTHNANIVFGSGFDIVSSDNFAIYDSTGTRDRFSFSTSNLYDTRSGGVHSFKIAGTNVANLTGNTAVFSPTVGTIASTDKVFEIYPTLVANTAHQVRNFVKLTDLYNNNENGHALYIKSLTNGVHYGGWMLNSTWGGSIRLGAAADGAEAANSIPTSYVQISSTTLSTTNLTLSVGDTTITGFANVSVSVNSASLTVGSSFIANTTGAYHTGTINAASHTVGSSLIANSTGVYHTGVVNAASHTVGSSLIANSTGVYHTGIVNAASHTVGSNFIANSTGTYHTGVVNAASHTVGTSFIANSTGITSTGFANVATTLQVGTNTSTFGTAAYITATGNVGIGTSSPTVKMEIGGDLLVTGETVGVRTRFISGKASPGNTAGPLYMQWNSSDFVQVGGTSGSANFLVSNGDVGIGTTSPAARLHVSGGSVRVQHPGDRAIDFVRSGANSYSIEHDTARMYFYNVSTANVLLVFDNGGNIGIGTSSPGYKLEVNGSFAATTKSFVIDHPTKPDMKLRYGSLEGPENGVYVRGKLKDFNVIVLPDYWVGLVDEDSITVNLTAIGKYQKLYVEEIKNNCVYIGNDNLLNKNIECFYTVYAERKDVEKIIVEY